MTADERMLSAEELDTIRDWYPSRSHSVGRLLAHIAALAERLEAAEARCTALRAAIEENTFHEVDEYTGTCLTNCWRCVLLRAHLKERAGEWLGVGRRS